MNNDSLARGTAPSLGRVMVVLLAAALAASLLTALFAQPAQAKHHHHKHHKGTVKASPNPVVFSTTDLGPKNVTITNNTGKTVKVDPISGTGFTTGLNLPLTIKPGETQIVPITADATAATGTLKVVDAAGTKVLKTVTLKGPLA